MIDDLVASARRQTSTAPPLRVAALSRHAQTIVAPAIARLLAAQPDTGPITLDMHAQRDFGYSRLARPFDVGFGHLVGSPDNLDIQVLAQSPLVVVLPPGHSSRDCTGLSLSQMASEPFIALAGDTVIGKAVSAAFDGAMPANVVAKVSHTYLALDLVAAGIGLHVTDRLAAIDAERRGCTLIPLSPALSLAFCTFQPRRTASVGSRCAALIETVEALVAERLDMSTQSSASEPEQTASALSLKAKAPVF